MSKNPTPQADASEFTEQEMTTEPPATAPSKPAKKKAPKKVADPTLHPEPKVKATKPSTKPLDGLLKRMLGSATPPKLPTGREARAAAKKAQKAKAVKKPKQSNPLVGRPPISGVRGESWTIYKTKVNRETHDAFHAEATRRNLSPSELLRWMVMVSIKPSQRIRPNPPKE